MEEDYVPSPNSGFSYFILASMQKHNYKDLFEKIDRREIDIYKNNPNLDYNVISGNIDGCICSEPSARIREFYPLLLNPKAREWS